MAKWKIYSALMIAMILWGLNVSWLKIIVSTGNPLTLQSVRLMLASFGIFAILFLLKKPLRVPKAAWGTLLLGCLLGVVVHHILLAYGLYYTTGTKGAIISGMSSLLTVGVAILFKDTVFTMQKALSFLLGAFGIVIAVYKTGESYAFAIGDLLVFLSFLVQAFSFMAIRRGTKYISPIVMTAWMLLLGSTMLFLYSIIFQPKSFHVFQTFGAEDWLIFVASALLATAIAHSLYNVCIQQIGPGQTAIFNNFNTVFGLIGAYFILGEVLTLRQLIGCLLVLMAVLCATIPIRKKANVK